MSSNVPKDWCRLIFLAAAKRPRGRCEPLDSHLERMLCAAEQNPGYDLHGAELSTFGM